MQLVRQPKYPLLFPDFQIKYIRRLAANVLSVLPFQNYSYFDLVSPHSTIL